jgi:3-deoxy-manno-octulosonate cytidylyltransferase (CMP-KDO synthetase)
VRYVILIPARLGSTRLPEKVLAPIGPRPLVQLTWERACAAPGVAEVLVLTDDARVEAAVRAFGGEVRRTRADHPSGTDRCAEAAAVLDADVIVNLQADEPFVEPQDLADLAAAVASGGAEIATLGFPFEDDAHRADPSAVKALVGPDGLAVGFQRADPGPSASAEVLHHLGVYAFDRARLLGFPALAPTAGERRERLEQLRALEHGWRIRVLRARAPAFGIDTPADLARLRARLGVGEPG